MPVKCRTIVAALEKLAPPHLAAAWDNIGLLVGSPDQDIAAVRIALDVTPELAARAAADRVDLIVAHHPLILKGLTSLRTDRPQGRTLAALLAAGIAVYAAHTNLDVADGGVNDILAARLALTDLRPLTVDGHDQLLKLAVFVPESHADAVRQAIAAAGAGHIGNYSHCTFQTAGTGAFLPLTGATPFIGRPGALEYVAEYRIETILPAAIADIVVAAMHKAHPYEEVAYDLYPLLNPGRAFGLGRVGQLTAPEPVDTFVSRVKAALGLARVKLAGPTDRHIRTVAVCGGSGGSLVADAARAGADILVTGDVKYHEALEAAALGLTVLDAGHYATERPVVDAVAAHLTACAHDGGWHVAITTDTLASDIFRMG